MNKITSTLLIFCFLLLNVQAFAQDNAQQEEIKREAKTFAFFKKREQKVKKEQPSSIVENKVEEKSEEIEGEKIQKEDKPHKITLKEKKIQKFEEKYEKYSIPTDGYMSVGDSSDKTIKISGSIEKTMELNLADCLELALINNPKVKSAYSKALAVQYKKGQTISNYTPNLTWQTSINRIAPDMSTFKSRNITVDPFTKYTLGTISLSQLVYDFGYTQNKYTIDKLNWEASKANIDAVVNDVVYLVKDRYYNLIYAIEAKNVAKETLEQFEAMYRQAQAFYEVGTKPKVDVTIAQVNMEDARANYINASNNVDIAVSSLNNAMGLPFVPAYIIDISTPFQDVDITMRKAVEIANEARPDLKTAKINVEVAEQTLKLTKKSYLPKLQIAADFAIGGVDSFVDTKWWNFGGFLNIPTVNPVLVRNQIKEARAEWERQQYDSKAQVNDIYYEIQSTFVKLMDAKQRVPVARLAVKKAKENYELSSGRYRVGVNDAIEFKESQIQYYNARLSYLNTIYQFNSAKAALEKAIGQTLATVEQSGDEI